MSTYKVLMPKLGESVHEATITKWHLKVGDPVEEDSALLDVATDKVDSEIPSPVDGVIKELCFNVDDVVPVGSVIAILTVEGGEEEDEEEEELEEEEDVKPEPEAKKIQENLKPEQATSTLSLSNDGNAFYSPLVKKIAQENNLQESELKSISGTGLNNRITRDDLLNYLSTRSSVKSSEGRPQETLPAEVVSAKTQSTVVTNAGDEIVPLDRMRKIIAEHMVNAKHTAPHVTSVIEVDITPLVEWRNKHKDAFQKKYGEKLTFMPIFVEAAAKALRDFPRINSSLSGDNLIIRKDVNIGLAVALPTGNLIVPVIKNADQKNLAGLSHSINDLADKARNNKLAVDDIQGGTFTISNFGSFKTIIGTPIINVPEVAILATGSIEKKVAVIETPNGDTFGIRSLMYLSLSFDHRIVDGMLGGLFLKAIGDYLEQFDVNRGV